MIVAIHLEQDTDTGVYKNEVVKTFRNIDLYQIDVIRGFSGLGAVLTDVMWLYKKGSWWNSFPGSKTGYCSYYMVLDADKQEEVFTGVLNVVGNGDDYKDVMVYMDGLVSSVIRSDKLSKIL